MFIPSRNQKSFWFLGAWGPGPWSERGGVFTPPSLGEYDPHPQNHPSLDTLPLRCGGGETRARSQLVTSKSGAYHRQHPPGMKCVQRTATTPGGGGLKKKNTYARLPIDSPPKKLKTTKLHRGRSRWTMKKERRGGPGRRGGDSLPCARNSIDWEKGCQTSLLLSRSHNINFGLLGTNENCVCVQMQATSLDFGGGGMGSGAATEGH